MENLSERIEEKLYLINEDSTKFKPFMMEYLRKIETYLVYLEKDYNEALNTLKLKKCSVSAVAKEFNMSRTTLYNHSALLKRYIEISEELLVQDSPLQHFEKMKTENDVLKTKIEMLYDRDVTLELQSHQIRELSKKLKEKNQEINRLETRNRKLSSELNILKRESRSILNVTKINR